MMGTGMTASPAPFRLSIHSILLSAALVAAGCEGPRQPDPTGHAQSGQSRPAVSASESLDAVIRDYAEVRRAESDRIKLRDVTAESFLEEIAANRRMLDELHGVDAAELSAPERIDRQLLIGLLESDIYSAEKRRMWEIDASIYVPARQIGLLLQPLSEAPVERRITNLLELLAKIPERVEAGKRNLREPPKRFTDAAIFRTEGTIRSLAEDAPGLAAQSEESGAALMEAVENAIRTLEGYATFLRDDLLPRSTGTWAIGKEHYDYILRHRWHLDADAADILARGRSAFEETEALAQEVSERIEPGRHWSEVYEKLKDEHPAADEIKAAYQGQIEAAQKFVRDNRIVTLPAGEHVITVDTPPAMRRSSPFGTFQSVDQFDDGLQGRLVLTPIEDWMTEQQRAERLRSHHLAWIPIIAVHEAYPGHHVDALKTRENPRLLRKVVREPIFSEGWGLFTEELMFELGFLEGDEIRLTQLRNRLWRAARVIVDSSLHTGRMTFDEGVDFLVEKVRFERYAAELEVGMYTVRPTYVLGYLIGMQEIMSIREDYVARFGEPSPPSEFYDKLLSLGAIPPVLVRKALLEETAEEAVAAEGEVEGLWMYTGLETSSGQRLPLTGIFLFKDGFFLQQAVFEGEPFEEQGGMAHAGPYTVEPESIHLIAEQTISTAPGADTPLSFRHDTEHDVTVTRSADALTLVFGSGTVQEFERVGDGRGEVYSLEDGALAFVDDYFILVQGDADGVVTAYGTFEKAGEELQLGITRWVEADETGALNRRDVTMQAVFDGHALTLEDGRRFPIAD